MASSSTGRTGRPREFDVDSALESALLVFWEKGYEGATLAELTAAMGITKASLYAAFGNKEQLFRKALQRYDEGPAGYARRAMREPSARGVAGAIVHGAARATTSPGAPQGCFGVQGALATGADGAPARAVLSSWRNAACKELEERFQRAVDEADLPRDCDPGDLARYVMAVAFGIAVHAAGGVGHDDLDEIAETSLRALPV